MAHHNDRAMSLRETVNLNGSSEFTENILRYLSVCACHQGGCRAIVHRLQGCLASPLRYRHVQPPSHSRRLVYDFLECLSTAVLSAKSHRLLSTLTPSLPEGRGRRRCCRSQLKTTISVGSGNTHSTSAFSASCHVSNPYFSIPICSGTVEWLGPFK